jgi:hypothetical protein
MVWVLRLSFAARGSLFRVVLIAEISASHAAEPA